MLLHQDKYCLVTLDSANSLLEVKWLSVPDPDAFVKYFTMCLDFSEKYHVKYVLADNTLGVQIDVATQRRVIEIGGERLKKIVVKKYARVVPMDAFQEMVSYKIATEILKLVPNDMELMVFSNTDSARTWLLGSTVSVKITTA
ncbi:hypothetical protein [Pontibacter vulgaris]|uniref:hypothetical protein n=1 Tax=Pontibacter vulgaris TaxID=2905679 RepID=UPI001FA6F740|nr:hypothetical protein [Pontibacter vulgaris]